MSISPQSTTLPNGDRIRIGDFVKIINVVSPHDGPPLGEICKVVALNGGLVQVETKTIPHVYGKMPRNVALYSSDLELDVGL